MSYQITFLVDDNTRICDTKGCADYCSVSIRQQGRPIYLCVHHFEGWVGKQLIQKPVSEELDEVIFGEPKGEQLYPDMHVHGCCHEWDTDRNYMIAVASSTGFPVSIKQDDYLHVPAGIPGLMFKVCKQCGEVRFLPRTK